MSNSHNQSSTVPDETENVIGGVSRLPHEAHLTPEELQAVRNRGKGQYGCSHYRRRVKFITPCCNEEWWCRHCHNEAKYQQEEDWNKKHELERKKITQLVCALCNHHQPVGTYCISCGASFGAYSCTKCPFYDDELSKKTYHCDECGICRVGGRENYFHCSTCGSCYAANLQGNHVCVERAMHQNCPVCFEFLFESVDPTTVLKCGHTIHSQCLRDLEKNTAAICPSCPICKKSLGNYDRYWRALDREIGATPVPAEYRNWQANILCNDCSASCTVPFNLIAHKCEECGSYNTRRMGLIVDGGEPAVDVNDGIAALPQGGAGDAGIAAAAAANAAILQAMQAMMGGVDDDDEEEEGDDEGFEEIPILQPPAGNGGGAVDIDEEFEDAPEGD